MADFAERLKELRLAAGLKQTDMALQLGMTINQNKRASCSTTCYGYYERGMREPNITKIKKICEVLNCDANYLLGITDTHEALVQTSIQDFSTDELLAELKRRWDDYGR